MSAERLGLGKEVRFRLGDLLITPDAAEIDGARVDPKTMDMPVALKPSYFTSNSQSASSKGFAVWMSLLRRSSGETQVWLKLRRRRRPRS